MTEIDAVEFFKDRVRVFTGKQLNNANLPAGSKMYYYCRFCSAPSDALPECHLNPPKLVCRECTAFQKKFPEIFGKLTSKESLKAK